MRYISSPPLFGHFAVWVTQQPLVIDEQPDFYLVLSQKIQCFTYGIRMDMMGLQIVALRVDQQTTIEPREGQFNV